MYPPRKQLNNSQQSLYNRIIRFIPANAHLNSLLLRFRRFRRFFRPIFPVTIRAFIVILTALTFRPFSYIFTPSSLSSDAPSQLTNDVVDPSLIGILSRLGIVTGIISSFLSLIFFDIRLFNFATIISFIFHFIFMSITSTTTTSSSNYNQYIILLAFICFHTTAILFSTLVGRRRSISKPIALRKKSYLANLPNGIRHVDILDAAIRLQTSILTLDYATSFLSSFPQSLPLSNSKSSSMILPFLVTLPFAISFIVGYSTQNNGIITLIILISLALLNEKSPLLGFNFINTASTACAALLGLSVGPGLLTVDEWLATNNQLCY